MKPTFVAAALALGAALSAQATESRAVEHALPSHESSRYFTIPPRAEAERHPLLVVLPGGPGTADFLPFVENGILGAAPADCVGVMVTAVKWRDDQEIVWPTAKSKVPGMRWTTEDHVLAVVEAVRKEHAIDPARVALLAWSSSGPAAWVLTTAKKTPFGRAYVAMSVWRPQSRSALRSAKGRRFVLDQSAEDTVTPFDHCREAFAALDGAGAVVRLSTYGGGHGWNDGPIPRLQRNLAWLFGDEPAPEPEWPGAEPELDRDGNLLANGGFEQGTKGWREIGNSRRLVVEAVADEKAEGERALHLTKTGGVPLDLVTQEVRLGEGDEVTFAVRMKCRGCRNGWIKVWLYDEAGEPVAEDVDVTAIRGDADWREYRKSWPRGAAVRAVVQVVMILDGELWLDDAVLTVDG